MIKFYNINLINISFLIILYPFSLLSGPFISDTIVCLVCLFFIINIIIKKNYKFFNNNLTYLFIILFLYLIFNSFISQNPFLSFESSLFYFRHWLFCIGFAYCVLNNFNILKYFFISITIMLIILISDSYLQYFTGTNLTDFKYDGFRLSSFFGDELILGGFLSRFFPILVGIIFFFSNNQKFQFVTLVIISIIIGSLVILSGERTALFLFISYLFFFSIINTKKRHFFMYTFLIMIITFISLILTNKNIEKRIINYTLNQLLEKKLEINSAITDENVNVSHIFSSIKGLKLNEISFFSIQHEVVYKTAYKIFLDNKLFGIGPKNFREVCKISKYQTLNKMDPSINGCQTHPHNIQLQILVETGFVGYTLFLIIYINIIMLIIKKHISSKDTFDSLNFLKIFFLISIFLNFFPLIPSGNFFNNYFSNLLYLPFAIYISLVFIKLEKKI